ncbi:hypothetical protein V8C34DRAFT_318938 [Trichoderma compactum]
MSSPAIRLAYILSALFVALKICPQTISEKSPKVLLSTLRYNKEPEYNHAFTDFPVSSTEYRIYYLSQDGTLAWSPDQMSTKLSYQSDVTALQIDSDSEELGFDCTLPADSYLVGKIFRKFT